MRRHVDSKHPLWVGLALLTVVFGVGFLTLPARLYTGDPKAWREEARSIVSKWSLIGEDPKVATFIITGKKRSWFVYNEVDGQWHSRHGVFNGVFSTPPFLVEWFITGDLPARDRPIRIFLAGIYSLLLTVVIAHLLYAITGFCCCQRSSRQDRLCPADILYDISLELPAVD